MAAALLRFKYANELDDIITEFPVVQESPKKRKFV